MIEHRYAASSTIARVEERFDKSYVSGVGVDAVFKNISTGWWVVTEGPSPATVHVGDKNPGHRVGDAVTIVIAIRSEETK